MSKVSAIIPTLWKAKKFTDHLVDVLIEDESVGEIIIIDNAPGDFSYDNIIDGSNDSSDEIEMETSIEDEQQENIETRTIINNIQNPLNIAVRNFLSVINSNHDITDT